MRTPEAYQNQLVRVRLNPGSYSVVRNEVHFPSPIGGVPPAVVWECVLTVPGDTGKSLVIVGRVSRVIYDGEFRTAAVQWQVRLTDCTVAVAGP